MSGSMRGQFLIAGKQLIDPNFFRTVILIVEHSGEGAMGLVINRPSSVSVANALSQHFELPETEEVVYVGGPVEPAALFILHNSAEIEGDQERPVSPGLFVGSSADVFESVVRAYAANEPGSAFRIFSGCAGWASNQLEGEIARGDWYVLPASPQIVFHDDPYDAWDLSLQKIYESNRIVPHLVRNSEWN